MRGSGVTDGSAGQAVEARRDHPGTGLRQALCRGTALAGAARLAVIAAVAALGLPALPAFANPEGGVVTDGSAVIQSTGPGRLDVIQSTPKAVIDWKRFGIAEGEHTNFQQPDANSITLNRVTGPDPSAIMGRLTANGQVWLVNPNGILFGPNASVDVGGLVATTHDIRNEDFMAGRHSFEGRAGSTATVENEGSITVAQAGLAALVAPGVANRGTIQARMGEVTLASGRRFVVDLFGDQKINIAVDAKTDARPVGADGKPVDALVSNSGRIFADGGRVQMTASAAKGLVDRVVNMSGTVQARRVEQQGGDIVLLGDGGEVEVSGTLDASGRNAGQTGGSVSVSGDRTALTGKARIDASGAAGGGEVLVGGDVQGGKASAATLAGYGIRPARKPVPPSAETVVAQAATIAADATESGKGGKVVVWADGGTRFDGAISARGGAAGGNGGFVETSGKLSLQVRGRVDAGASAGKGGSWLLDPTDIRVSSSGGTISAATIEASLNTGTAVTLQTDSAISGNGDITVDEAIVKSYGGDTSLTLNAYRNIIVNEGIRSDSGALTLVLNAGNTGDEDTRDGAVRIGKESGAISINTRGGSFLVGGGINPSLYAATGLPLAGYASGVNLLNATIDTGAGSITISGNGGLYDGGGNHGIALRNSQLLTTSGAVTLTGAGGISNCPVQTCDQNLYGGDNLGVLLDAATVHSLSGIVTVTGAAGHNDQDYFPGHPIGNSLGVRLRGSRLESDNGAIIIAGSGGTDRSESGVGNQAIVIEGSSQLIGLGGTSITLTSGGGWNDDIVLDSSTVTTQSGAIRVDAARDLITMNLALTGGGTTTLKAGSGVSLMSTTINSSGTPVVVNSGADSSGPILIAGSTIQTHGGAITLGGGNDPGASPATGNEKNATGVTIESSELLSDGGTIAITGEGSHYDGDGHGVAIIGQSRIGSGTGKIAIRGKSVSYSGWSAGVMIASDDGGRPILQSASTAADAILIDGDASEADAEEAWGAKIQGSAEIRSAGGVAITGRAGTSAAISEVAGIGLDAETDGNIQIVAAAGEVTLQGTAGTGEKASDVYRNGDVTISSTPAPPPPPPPVTPPPVTPPPVTPTLPEVPEVPATPATPTTPAAPTTPETGGGDGGGPGTPSTGTPGTDASGTNPEGTGSTGSASSDTSSSTGQSALAGNGSVQTVLQPVAQIMASPTTATPPTIAPATGTSAAATTPQTFLSALEQGTATQSMVPRSGEGQGTQTTGGNSSSGSAPISPPPPPPPGPSTVVLPSGRSVTFTAEATQAYASGATLSQPGPQLLASPQVQAAAGSIIQAAGSGGMVQAVTALATGGLSLPEQRAVLASVPVPTLIGGLTASSDPVAVLVGGILQNSAAGQPGGYAQVRATVTQANLPPQVVRTYLAMVQRVEREQRTQAFAGALRQLVANPAAADMLGRPTASSAPPALQQARGGRTRGGTMTLRGIVADSANLAEARVNGRWVFIDEQGQFRTSIPVEPGATEATLTMTDETGKTTEQRIAIDAAAAAPDPAAPPKPRKIALMIAVDTYRDTGIPALVTPEADIKAVGKALNDQLGYETRVLRNPTKAQIGEALRKLGREVSEQDQVMVYYAGHGYELAETGTGYWLPADAETTSARNWVSNNDIGRFLSRMPAKHVMVVSDSCYSGAFTKEQKVDASRIASEQEIRQRRSVMALSSGGDEPVADGDVNSPFAAALKKRVLALPKDSNGYALYQEVRDDVTRDAPQTPQYGVIRTAGYDEGGDFLLELPDRPMN
ncbi:filamentous hemagglutinin N-terminal domain-containing protein [Azospirillum ramasamyi]|uniref:two-partner secretion domain-containing protein n=1 Tax=Azospirillum ramasamyi TaxID=682998 RepID=UPI001FE421B0|nr:filamentous hemagglutinin N-terminal domain-containing protein [Azospirillum ramasamyi]